MTNKNIVIFSSGISEKSGLTEGIKSRLNEMGYACSAWRELFSSAHDMSNIALLPMLIKKIPTFDFAVLVCEGHDVTYISRGERSETVKTMRDNVIFEIGLCAMAVGLNRTILVTDRDVHLPDDLRGVHGELALKRIEFPFESDGIRVDTDSICRQIHLHIEQEKERINQIVIGAAASGACGYAANFVCRTLEHIDDEMTVWVDGEEKRMRVAPDKVHIHIIFPDTLNKEILDAIREEQQYLHRGSIPTARSRAAEFYFCFKGDEMHIIDYPTNIATSYDTARIILQMDADDTYDEKASTRFVEKEMALFESTLKTVLGESFIRQVIEEHYPVASDTQKEKMLRNVLDVVSNRLSVTRYEESNAM